MIIRSIFDLDEDNTITVEYEDGEPIPEEEDVIYLPDSLDEGVRVGRILYHKFNVVTYEIIERNVLGSFGDSDLIG
jgi:hypothetical protein